MSHALVSTAFNKDLFSFYIRTTVIVVVSMLGLKDILNPYFPIVLTFRNTPIL